MTIRFGAYRASVYATTAASKAAALAIAAKDQVQEAHTRKRMVLDVRHIILDEEFPGYQLLLDNAEVKPTPITLFCLPALGPAPSSFSR
jgi:hypothetical protein